MFMSKLNSQVVQTLDAPAVKTANGRVRGIVKDGMYLFRGLVYARAGRFQPPQDPEPWDIRDALAYGPEAPKPVTPIAKDQQYNPHYYLPQNENCQNLNVWTPSLDENAAMPVVVWLHGGAWRAGSAVEQYAYDGEEMSRYGKVVFVSVNYRLNVLGFLDLSEYSEKYRYSNQGGLRDLIKALEWIRDNIRNFGGDPGNVTLIGQSGGGSKVFDVMSVPSADGLYHKVCIGSGLYKPGAPAGRTYKELNLRMAELVVQNLGLTKDTIEKIETVNYWLLVDAVQKATEQLASETGNFRFNWKPYPDGDYMVDDIFRGHYREAVLEKPMMFGSSFGEQQSNLRLAGRIPRCNWTDGDRQMYLKKRFGDKAAEASEAFEKAYPDRDPGDAAFAATVVRRKIIGVAREITAAGGKAWNWIFNHDSLINGGIIAWHCGDNPFVTHNAAYSEAAYEPGVSDALEDAMCSSWVSFAYNGDPNNSLIPNWEPISADCVPTMIFQKNIVCKNDYDADFLTFE